MLYEVIYKIFFLFSLIFLVSRLASADEVIEDQYIITELLVKGNRRTNIDWLQTYIGLSVPQQLTSSDLRAIRQKLLTTNVFTNVETKVIEKEGRPKEFVLVIELDEKWTTIPVIRGALGGGTPLRVFGIYDTHSFGRLWTLGGETRKYGNAPNGYVIWARAPRWLEGKHVLGIEYWRDFRVRTIYDEQDKPLGSIDSDISKLRLLFMMPTIQARVLSNKPWQWGFDLNLQKIAPARYHIAYQASSEEPPPAINLPDKKDFQTTLLINLIQDDINIDHTRMQGSRMILLSGPIFSEEHSAWKTEVELFYYFFLTRTLNFATHFFIGQSTSDELQNQYFLGGFDSVRGLPDGAMYGTRADYLNLELRKEVKHYKYSHIQSVIFIDAGGAGPDWNEAFAEYRSSAGLGLRISIPQIYRMMFRVDYAWSLDKPGTSGFSAGLNHFFEPHKPL